MTKTKLVCYWKKMVNYILKDYIKDCNLYSLINAQFSSYYYHYYLRGFKKIFLKVPLIGWSGHVKAENHAKLSLLKLTHLSSSWQFLNFFSDSALAQLNFSSNIGSYNLFHFTLWPQKAKYTLPLYRKGLFPALNR